MKSGFFDLSQDGFEPQSVTQRVSPLVEKTVERLVLKSIHDFSSSRKLPKVSLNDIGDPKRCPYSIERIKEFESLS